MTYRDSDIVRKFIHSQNEVILLTTEVGKPPGLWGFFYLWGCGLNM